MRKASIHRLKDKYKSQLTRERQPTYPTFKPTESPHKSHGDSSSTKPITSTRKNIVRQNVKQNGGASDYYSKFKNRNKPSTTLSSVEDKTEKISSTVATTKADKEMMHIAPSSNFQNIHESDYEEDDYEEDDVIKESDVTEDVVENRSENIISSTSRSTTTTAPISVTATTTTDSTTTRTTTFSTTRTATTGTTTTTMEDEPVESNAPFFPTRMTMANTERSSYPTRMTPTEPEKPSTTSTTTTRTTTAVAQSKFDEKDKEMSLKDLLRSGKYGNDPTKIRDLLKNFKNGPAEGGEKSADQDEVDPKDIFKKYADLAKAKATEVKI